jgi:hypothetical protein
MSRLVKMLLLLGAAAGLTARAQAMDFVVLSDGRVVQGAILRQDSATVTMTDWETRHFLQPPLQVYTKQEVQSIWFSQPEQAANSRAMFRPRPLQVELAGGLAFQTSAGTEYERESLVQVSVQAGLPVTRSYGFEVDAIYSGPSSRTGYERGFQTLANIAVYPFVVHGFVPFVVAGGGAAITVPYDRSALAVADTLGETYVGNVVDVGAGVKTGVDGFGMRLDIRHHYYSWSVLRPYDTQVNGETVTQNRRERIEADMTVFRVSVFTYF